MQISAVVITYNEARNIGRCLESLRGVADEIVVLDSFSTDTTAEICRSYGVRFEQHAFDGHIEQKNRALSLATHPVVLSLDADEALSDRLRQSVLQVKEASEPAAGYTMNRLTNYCGKWIRHSGWYPDRKLRLFDKRLGQWGGTNPHDKVLMQAGARTAFLEGDLLHYSYYTEAEHLERSRKYADIAAKAMQAKGRKGSWIQVLFSPIVKFLRNYVLKMGVLDGRAGFRICYVAALETYWKYRKLLHMNRTAVLLPLLLTLIACSGPKKTPDTGQTTATTYQQETSTEKYQTYQDSRTGMIWAKNEQLAPVLEQAKREKKPVFVKYYAEWCGPCKMMDSEVFTKPELVGYLNNNCLNIHTDVDTDSGAAIAERYGIKALPTMLFIDPQGVVLEKAVGVQSVAWVKSMAESAVEKMKTRR